jgi:bifunctional UDP-N-acetylglucosamine pyrophosphorylase/glucosamine-1-phosphate N-acetyltransferase
MNSFTAIVLAAGKGKRMKSSFPKVLHRLIDKPLIWYILKELTSLKYIRQIIIVVGYKGKEVEEKLIKEFKNLEFVYQKRTLGTAHAVRCAQNLVKHKKVLVICGDTPLITSSTLSSFITSFLKKKVSCSLITAYKYGRHTLGRIFRDEKGRVKMIKEAIENPEIDSKEVNSGIYCFEKEVLFDNLRKIKKNKNKQEYFLTDIIEILYRQGKKIDSYLLDNDEEIIGINTKSELCIAEKVLRRRTCEEFIEKGVKIIDPYTTFIDMEVSIGKNTVIFPFTFIEKNVIIGANCLIGPFVHLREGTSIGNNTYVGNFLEVNRSKIGNHVKMKHFGYIGDATVKDNVNIGAGTVVANFDGKRKNKTLIEKDAFIGSDTILVAPIKIGKGAITGAGSVVTKNVKPKTIVVGVPAKFLKEVK